jgi:hypothetical protein
VTVIVRVVQHHSELQLEMRYSEGMHAVAGGNLTQRSALVRKRMMTSIAMGQSLRLIFSQSDTPNARFQIGMRMSSVCNNFTILPSFYNLTQ